MTVGKMTKNQIPTALRIRLQKAYKPGKLAWKVKFQPPKFQSL